MLIKKVDELKIKRNQLITKRLRLYTIVPKITSKFREYNERLVNNLLNK